MAQPRCSRLPAALALMALGASACIDSPPTAPGESASFDRVGAPGQQRAPGLDGELARIARDAPGFGGMFYDGNGRLNIYVTAATQQSVQARQNVLERVRSSLQVHGRSTPPATDITVLEGTRDYNELAALHTRMLPVLAEPGVVFTDIDETQNRLRVGVLADASDAQVQGALQALGVPVDAVSIEITEPIVPISGHTLRNVQDPIGGGLQLVWERPGVGFFLCTLGFNVLRTAPGKSERYFFTNSHCSAEQGTVNGTEYWQPLPPQFGAGTLVGFEIEDPPFFTSPCFTGFVCRWSDAALAQVIPDTPARIGTIFRTKSFGTDNTAGSIEVEDVERKFFSIVAERDFPMMGEVLDKVGRTTGWTRGPVIATCINAGVAGTDPPIAMLCQDRVQAGVGGGDSGSPVFQQVGNSKDATLYGILWGSAPLGGLQTFVFSALINIREDFGSFRTH
jgi:hypothetical protein